MDIHEKLNQHIAVIDLGSNTFNLIIGRLNQFKILCKHREAVGIGNLSYGNNQLSSVAIQKAVNAVSSFIDICSAYNVSEIHCYATSAIRDAINNKLLVDALSDIDDRIIVKVINGDEEASLIARGVSILVPKPLSYLIMDIGGGSVEFIIVSNDKTIWKKSYDIGIARLVQYFPPTNPLSNFDVNLVLTYLLNELSDLLEICKLHNIHSLVGASGSFETYFILLNKLSTPEYAKINSTSVLQLLDQLIYSSQEELFSNNNIPDFRVRLLPYASLLVRLIITELSIGNIIYSDYSMKEGVYDMLLVKDIK